MEKQRMTAEKRGHMWCVKSATNIYWVNDGSYTAMRHVKGRSRHVSIMHSRFAGLRLKIDSAIKVTALRYQAPSIE